MLAKYLAYRSDRQDISFPERQLAGLSASIATSSAELVLIVNLVGAVAGDTRRRYIGLLHAVDGDAGRVVFAANLGVAGVGSVLVEG
jgi:hypothetical protein